MSDEGNVEALREAIAEIRRALIMDRWAIGGVCAIGAWLIFIVTAQLGEFRGTLRGVSDTMVQVQIAAERVAAKVEQIDRVGGDALRDHIREPRGIAHPKE